VRVMGGVGDLAMCVQGPAVEVSSSKRRKGTVLLFRPSEWELRGKGLHTEQSDQLEHFPRETNKVLNLATSLHPEGRGGIFISEGKNKKDQERP